MNSKVRYLIPDAQPVAVLARFKPRFSTKLPTLILNVPLLEMDMRRWPVETQ